MFGITWENKMIERLEEESQKNYSLYCVYQNMGRNRSLAKVSEQTGISKRWIESLSSKYDWIHRTEVYDTHQQQLMYEGMAKEIKEMGKRQASYSLQMITALITPAQELLKRLKDKNGKLDFSDVSDTDLVQTVSRCATAFKLLTDVERLARGEPTDIQALSVKPKIDTNFIDKIGSNEESSKLATELLAKIKDTN